jgi:hypothetical protein
MHPCSCLRPCLERGVFPTGYLLGFSKHLSHLNALFYDSPIPPIFIYSHLVKPTNYGVQLYKIFSKLLLEILLDPQSHSPQNPVWELFIQIGATPPETTNYTRFIWTSSRWNTMTQTHVCIYAAYKIQISMNLYRERLSYSFNITLLSVYAYWFHVFWNSNSIYISKGEAYVE